MDWRDNFPISDDALATARDIVDGTVCRCAHTDSDHICELVEAAPQYRACQVRDCACTRFDPIDVVVRPHDVDAALVFLAKEAAAALAGSTTDYAEAVRRLIREVEKEDSDADAAEDDE